MGYLALAVAIAGLIALAFGSTSWVLASGVIIWLATVPVTLTGLLWARHEFPSPGPGSCRLMKCHALPGPAIGVRVLSRGGYAGLRKSLRLGPGRSLQPIFSATTELRLPLTTQDGTLAASTLG